MLIPDWRDVLRYAWSVRWIAAAALLTSLEAMMPYLGVVLPVSDAVFSLLQAFTIGGAFVARFLVQKDLPDA